MLWLIAVLKSSLRSKLPCIWETVTYTFLQRLSWINRQSWSSPLLTQKTALSTRRMKAKIPRILIGYKKEGRERGENVLRLAQYFFKLWNPVQYITVWRLFSLLGHILLLWRFKLAVICIMHKYCQFLVDYIPVAWKYSFPLDFCHW